MYMEKELKLNQAANDCVTLQEPSFIKWEPAWGLFHQFDCILD